MIFFSIGLPGRFAEWCDALVLRLVARQHGSVAPVSLDDLEGLASAAIRARAANLVVCCRQPALRLQSEIVRAELPFVVALGDPRAALRDQVEVRGIALTDATRAVAGSCATLPTMARAPRALVLRAADVPDLPAMAAAIARHFGIGIADGELRRLVAELPAPRAGPKEHDASWAAGLGGREQAIVGGALDPYVRYFADGELRRLVWQPDLFFTNPEPAGSARIAATGPIDMTGRARCLVYGPYIALPPGPWSAEIVIGFSAEAAGISFLVDIYVGSQLAQTHIQPAAEQVVEASLQFTIDEAASQPVEIRIFSERAAFDGRIILGPVRLLPHEAVQDDIQQHLLGALRR